MGSVIGSTIGKLLTFLGFDNTDYRPIIVDTSGRILALVGSDGDTYLPLLTDADGHLLIKVSGQVPDADTVDGEHAAAFLHLSGGTMTGTLVLAGAPAADLHAATKKYVDDAGGGGTDLSDCILANEVMNYPSLEQANDAQPEWWEVSANAALTEVDVAGEAGITESYERAHKVVTTADGAYSYQRYTYADQPRVKSGSKLSAVFAVWAVGGKAARIRLQSSVGSLGVSSDTTAAAWTLLTVEGVTLDGTYVDIRCEVDTGTAYVVPLAIHIGSTAVQLPPRGLIYRHIDGAASLVNLGGSADPNTWTDVDCTATTNPLAAIALIHFWLYEPTSGYYLWWRRNGDPTAAGARHLAVEVNSGSTNAHNTLPILLDDGQVFEYCLDRFTGTSNLDGGGIDIHGFWEWA